MSTNNAFKILTPTEEWMSNYHNDGYFAILNIKDTPDSLNYFDLWLLGTNMDYDEI